MLINAYLISTLISIIIILKKDIDFLKKLNDKGYEYRDKKFIKKLNDFFNDLVFMLFPIINILIAVFMLLFMDCLFDEVFNDLYDKGKLKKKKR